MKNSVGRCSAFFLFLLFLAIRMTPHALGQKEKSNGAFIDADPPSNCVWTSAATFPIPIMDEAVVTFGNNIYTFCGVSEGSGVPDSYRFDGTSWTPIAPYPWACGVEYPSAVSDGTFIYIMNGSKFCPLVYSTDVFRYDPKTDTYTQLASNSVGTWNQTAVYLNGKIYKMGGKNAAGYQTALEIYDIGTNTWSLGAPLPETTGFAASWTKNGLIYMAGGVVVSGVPTNKIYCYDPAINTWTEVPGLAETRWGAAVAVYSDGVVLAGGLVDGVDYANISTSAIYLDGSGWLALPDMPERRARMNGTVLGGSFYVIGGFSSQADFLIGTTSNQKLTCQFGPTPTQVVSRKTHGAAGNFDVPLPLTGNVGIECRSGGGTNDYQMIIDFATSVTVGSAALTSGTGSVSSFSVSGSQVTVNLTGVTNVQRITVTLFNVNDGTHMGNVPVSMGVLVGDVNGNAVVNATDVALTKSRVGQLVGMSNFREDVNANGTISSTDVAIVKSDVGTSLPP